MKNNTEDDDPVIIIIQRVIKYDVSDFKIGVMTIQIKTKNCCFAVDKSLLENNQSKID